MPAGDNSRITPVWLEYWEGSNPSKVYKTSSDYIFSYPEYVSFSISGLKSNTGYCYRLNCGLDYSDINSFITITDPHYW